MNSKSLFEKPDSEIAWCPGCGNFMILKSLRQALTELALNPQQVVIVSGIGQAAKTPQYLNVHMFNGLHGRALPPATAIKVCNPRLTVIAEGGDGDMYGEGGNHFLHAIRRNPNIAHLVHNNMVYGLTKGQASPTSMAGFRTLVQTDGVISEPLNPLSLAISLGASFVARTFCGNISQTAEIIKKAIQHPGYALVDIFQPCVTFNKVNTFGWFKENTYSLVGHNLYDRKEALNRAMEKDRFPLGIFYIDEKKKSFEQQLHVHQEQNLKTSFIFRDLDQKKFKELLNSKK